MSELSDKLAPAERGHDEKARCSFAQLTQRWGTPDLIWLKTSSGIEIWRYIDGSGGGANSMWERQEVVT